jgi:hypothetical protein
MSAALEEGTSLNIDFDKVAKIGRDGHQVVPVVLQDVDSGDVIFIGYANEEAFRLTLERQSAVLYRPRETRSGTKARRRATPCLWLTCASTANRTRCCTASAATLAGHVTRATQAARPVPAVTTAW